jgi:hypothetical protein
VVAHPAGGHVGPPLQHSVWFRLCRVRNSFASQDEAPNPKRQIPNNIQWPKFQIPILNSASQKGCILFDDLVKSRNSIHCVIPAKAGIQSFPDVLDPGFRRGDDPRNFLRVHLVWEIGNRILMFI